MSERSLGNVVVAIKAVDEASSVMDKIQTNIGLLGGALSKLGGGFAAVGTIMSGLAAGGPAGAAIAAGGEVADALQQAIGKAALSEQTFKDLGIAVDKSGTSWDSVKDGTKTALDAMSSLTKYSDEDLAQALQRLLTYGMSYNDAMAALGPTMDFATAKQMDLTSAATLVGKGMEGNVAILKRYGVDIASSKDQVAALKAAHDAAATAIKKMGDGIDGWAISLTTAIDATPDFESGLEGAKDKAQYLIDQFQQGNIDLPQFTEAMTSLGVPLDDAKMKGGTAAAVLEKLNEQFGGTAQASTQTYAGAMDQLNNRLGEMSIKIGTVFLPMLTGLTKGMTGLVDDLGPIVKGFGDWFGEITNAPDFKALGDTIKTAFGSMIKDVGDLAGAFKDTNDAIGKMLDALGIKTPEGFTALSIVAKTFEGMWDMLVIEPLKITTLILQGLTIAFKTAADFINGPIKSMTDAIGGFIQWLEDTFQGFYNWLVGASLWPDLWNAVVSVATKGVSDLLAALGTAFLDPIKTAFETAGAGIKTAWDACWNSLTSPETLKGVIDGVKGLFSDIKSSIDTALSGIKGVWDAVWNSLALPEALRGVIDATKGLFNGIKGAIDTALGGIKGAWDTAWTAISSPIALGTTFTDIKTKFDQMNTDAGTALGKLKDDFVAKFGELAPGIQPAFDALIAANKASGDLMKGDWSAAVEDVKTAFSKGWEAIQTSAQTIWDAMKTASDTWIDGVKTKIGDTIAEIKTNWDTVWTGFETVSKTIQDTVKTNVDTWIVAVQTKITDTLATLKTNWDSGWNALTEIFDTVLPAIMKTLVDNLVTPVGDKINGLVKTVQDGWTATWTGLQGIFTGLTSSIQNTVAAVWDPLSSYLQTAFVNWGTWADNALTSIQGAINQGMVDLNKSLTDFMGTVYKAWVDFGAAMNTYMGTVVDAIKGTVDGAATYVQKILDGMADAARTAASTIGGILSQIAKSIQGTVNQAAGAAGTAGNSITSAFTTAWNTVAGAATDFYNWLVGHSLWPDLMGALVDQTEAGMSQVKASFEKGLGGVVMGAPTIPELTAAMNITGAQAVGASPTQAAPTQAPSQPTSVTLPVTVQIDGSTITRVIEKRLIANRQLSAWRSV